MKGMGQDEGLRRCSHRHSLERLGTLPLRGDCDVARTAPEGQDDTVVIDRENGADAADGFDLPRQSLTVLGQEGRRCEHKTSIRAAQLRLSKARDSPR